MKKKSTSQSAFFNLRVLIGLFVFLAGVFLALLATGAFSSVFAQGKGAKNNRSATQASPGTQTPDVVRMVGPVALNMDLRKLPYVAPKEEFEERVLTRYPHGTGQAGASARYGISGLAYVQQLLKNISGLVQRRPALARRRTAMAMSARIIMSKQSTSRSRSIIRTAPSCRARPHITHSSPP